MGWYFTAVPARLTLGVIIKFNRFLGVASLPIWFFLIVLNVIVICLFMYEFLVGIGYKIKNKTLAVAFLLWIFVWALIPVYLIKHFVK